jgi:uncharacterized protein (TIGR03066 family)
MKALQLLTAAAVVGLFAAVAGADDKKGDYAKLIVGKWEITKSHENGPPPGATIEFTKDGKLHIAFEKDGNKVERKAAYKVTGDKFTITHSDGGQEQTVEITIKKLDETTLAVANPEGKESEMTRKK